MSTNNVEDEFTASNSKEALIKQVRLDTTLIGVHHWVDIDALPNPQTQFKERIATTDQLILESSRSIYEIALDNRKADATPHTYESYAFSTFLERGKLDDIHHIEEGSDMFVLAQRYGLPTRDLALGLLVPYIRKTVEDAGDDKEYLQEVLRDFTGGFHEEFPSVTGLPEGELEGWMGGLSEILQYPHQ